MSTATKLAIPTGSWECQTTMLQISTAKPASWSNTGRRLHRDHTFVCGAERNFWLRPHLCGRGLFGCCSNGQCSKFTSHKGLHCLICAGVGLWACATSCIMVRILYTSAWMIVFVAVVLCLCVVIVLVVVVFVFVVLFVVVVFVVVVIVFVSHFQATTYSRTSLDSAKSCSTTKRRSRIVSKPQESRVVCIPSLHPPISFFYPIHSHRMRSCLVNLLAWSRWQGTEAGVSLERLTGHLAAAAPAQQQDLVRENYREYIQ